MKYTNLLLASALVATTMIPEVDAAESLTRIADFWSDRKTYYQQPVFWFSLINALQDTTDQSGGDTDSGTTTAAADSACIDSLNTFMGIAEQLQSTIISDTAYYASLAAKGNGAGSDFGFQVSKLSKYSNLGVAGFNFYNWCSVDYYAMAIGTNFQSTSGLLNFGTNVYWRVTGGETTMDDLVLGLAAKNPYTVGTNVGIFVRDMLAVEIPDMNDSSLQYYTPSTI